MVELMAVWSKVRDNGWSVRVGSAADDAKGIVHKDGQGSVVIIIILCSIDSCDVG